MAEESKWEAAYRIGRTGLTGLREVVNSESKWSETLDSIPLRCLI
jgi:hypothetical protein